MSTTHRGSEAPKTNYPWYFFTEMGAMVLLLGWTCFFVFSMIFELDFVWWIMIFLVALACIRPMLTTYVEPFTARLVLDGLTKEIRCLRKGLAWISPAETLGKIVDLKTDIKGVENETYTSKSGKVLATFVYSMAPDPSSDGAVITYESWELDAIKQAARAFISMTLSDYFLDKEKDEDILHKAKINKELFRDPADENILHKDVLDFAEKHGVIVEEIRLEDVDFDESVQTARDTVAKAQSIRRAKHELTDPKGEGIPMEEAVAAETVQMLNIPGLRKHIFDVRGVPNVRDITVLGGAGILGDDDKKKGGKK
jgi:hypothetical protein